MRELFTFLLVTLSVTVFAQPPGYYITASGLSGQPLRTALSSIIRPHTVLSYTPGLWNAYYTTDVKPGGELWDIYSDIPGGPPAYEYTPGASQCGSSAPTTEGVCYNREHTWPQSRFASATPMQTDLFIVYPTDYFVNNRRGDFPYGKVGAATQTFTNGSKIGNNTFAGAPMTSCYESIDSFKGDLARTYFYVSTCYKNDSAVFVSWEMATQVNFAPWAAQMLLEWHHNDPVSKKEVDRNNAVYAFQGNRNPFIDHPEYADCIWGTGDCTTAVPQVASSQNYFSLYPNPAAESIAVEWKLAPWPGNTVVRVVDVSGTPIYTAEQQAGKSRVVLSVKSWPKGVCFVQVITSSGAAMQKLVVN